MCRGRMKRAGVLPATRHGSTHVGDPAQENDGEVSMTSYRDPTQSSLMKGSTSHFPGLNVSSTIYKWDAWEMDNIQSFWRDCIVS